ncbi:MAG TPA: type II secretion system protein [Chthoniobacteraceae bacterium]|nr:type II secretion system protein [Chthoniobacteraceae bacterium]
MFPAPKCCPPPERLRSRPRRSYGFTLQELLIVMVIVAVLLAIAIPAIGTARRRASVATTASNLRQCLLMFQRLSVDQGGKVYVGANSSWIPKFWSAAYSSAFPGWDDRIELLKGSIFYDPGVAYDLAQGDKVVRSFGINTGIYTISHYAGKTPIYNLMLWRLNRPSATVLLASTGTDGGTVPVSSNLTPRGINFRYSEGKLAAIGYCDGHVAWATREELAEPLASKTHGFWTGQF